MRKMLQLNATLMMLFSIQVLFAQTVVTVTDCNLHGWTRQTPANTSLILKNEPSNQILGKGSMEFITLTNSIVRFRSTSYHNTLLSSITEFSYSSYVAHRENNLDAPFLVLQIDLNGDGRTDNNLEFDPRFQTGQYIAGGFPDQGATQVGIWQTWDLLHAAWWVGPTPDPDEGGEVFSLATYISRHPTARIVNDANIGGGGIRLSAGAPAPIFAPNFRGYADNVKIGINGETIVYNFEFSTADAGSDQMVIYGYGSNCTTLVGSAAGGVSPYSFSWSPGGSAPNMSSTQVCPAVTTNYTLTVTDANGCTRIDDVTVVVNDVRCGNKMDKIAVCHFGQELCVAAEAVKAHLQHGDILGSCHGGVTTAQSSRLVYSGTADSNPLKLRLYPNPFAAYARIAYTLPADGRVLIQLFDIAGREIATVANGDKTAGDYQILFARGKLPAGVYYCRLMFTSSGKSSVESERVIILPN